MDLFPPPLYINKIDAPLINQQKDYLLNGIGFHHGSLEGGHYNAININKELKKFIMYDDNVVNEISNDIIENVLKSSNSYLIVYV